MCVRERETAGGAGGRDGGRSRRIFVPSFERLFASQIYEEMKKGIDQLAVNLADGSILFDV